ncbi:MAG: GDSL-type esterase/lipase family protein [Planctomycetota bacterium]
MKTTLLTLLIAAACLLLSCPAFAQAIAEPSVAVTPVPRVEDRFTWWGERHAVKLAEADRGDAIQLVFIGDSITHGWEKAGAAIWDERFAPYGALNLGYSADRTEHVLWRLGLGDAGEENNEIGGLAPKLFVVMIGTNNTGHGVCGPEDTAAGVTAIVDRLLEVAPQSDVLLLAVFPRAAGPDDPARLTNNQVNQRIAALDDRPNVEFVDLAEVFLDDDGTLPTSVMPDRLHPNEHGYRLWADAITPVVERYLGEQP